MRKGVLSITDMGQREDLLLLPPSEQMRRMDFNICDKHLADKKIHLFIASQSWEEVRIHMHSDLDIKYIKFIVSKADKFTIIFEGPINENHITLLCDLYPDKSGSIRRHFMLGKDIRPVLVG